MNRGVVAVAEGVVRRLLRCVLGCALGALLAADASAHEVSAGEALYWSAGRDLVWALLDDPNRPTVMRSGLEEISVIAVDSEREQVYWAGPGAIYRASFDGSDPEVVASGFSFSEGLALDTQNQQIYWTSWDGDIRRIGFDGTGEVLLRSEGQRLYGLALDLARNTMYWAAADRFIYQAELDGSHRNSLVEGGVEPRGVAVDPVGGMVYWADGGEPVGSVKRTDRSGFGLVEEIYSTWFDNPIGVTLDLAAGKIYWTEWGIDRIARANLDGSEVEHVTYTGRPWGVARGPDPREPPVVRPNPTFEIAPVAVTGEAAPGAPAGESFSSLGVPSLNDAGDVAFRGAAAGRAGVWGPGATGALDLVARQGDQAPGLPLGVKLGAFSERISLNAAGELALGGTLEEGSGGVTYDDEVILGPDGPGALRVLAWRGHQAPGTAPGSLFTLLQPMASAQDLNDLGQVAYRAWLVRDTGDVDLTNNQGIWLAEPSGETRLLVRKGDRALPRPSGALFGSLSRPRLNELGQIAFVAGVTPDNYPGLWQLDASGDLALIARGGDPAPGAPPGALFEGFSLRALNDAGQVAFWGRAAPDEDGFELSGIWGPGPDGDLTLVVRSGEQAPDLPAGATFLRFSFQAALNDAGELLFYAYLSRGSGGVSWLNDTGLWRKWADGSLGLLVREGDPAPDLPEGTVFSSVGYPSTNPTSPDRFRLNDRGESLFEARLRNGSGDVTLANDRAIFFADAAGRLALVAREGDGLEVAPGDVRRVQTLEIQSAEPRSESTSGLNAKGQVAFLVGFEGGSQGIFLATPKDRDGDGDGVPDGEDECPNSDLSPTVVIDGCDSEVGNTLLADGCTLSDLVADCAATATNHGAFRRCVSELGEALQKEGIITPPEKDRILACAGQADIP